MALELPTIHAHDNAWRGNYDTDAIEWRPPRLPDPMGRYGHNAYPTCSWCGSLSPSVLLDLFRANMPVQLERADQKYGWPHKFYIDRLPLPQEILDLKLDRVVSKRYYHDGEGTAHEEITHTEPYTYDYAKFYNEHLYDYKDQNDLFVELTNEIANRTGVRFLLTEGRLMFRTNYAGR